MKILGSGSLPLGLSRDGHAGRKRSGLADEGTISKVVGRGWRPPQLPVGVRSICSMTMTGSFAVEGSTLRPN
jgi:hypothetical protein